MFAFFGANNIGELSLVYQQMIRVAGAWVCRGDPCGGALNQAAIGWPVWRVTDAGAELSQTPQPPPDGGVTLRLSAQCGVLAVDYVYYVATCAHRTSI